ncbi:hypothetical protein M407DRAFT_27030 [Tulasnella calospora MUT 4182]|uniref:F-box domain-containing protein n=1 Tax=Tulasnella calospora MUT 4182 TaxID=1051891 RepID=A0A0C3QEM3_9AGAM|nr:hypothetical protein M407DRAFT_27030 [Tulasnella calospora MUT 4182]
MADLVNLFKPKTESRASASSSPAGISAIGSPFHAYKKAKADFYGNRFTSALHILNQILECELARRRDIIDALLLRGEVRCAQNDRIAGHADFHAALAIDPRNSRISQLLQDGGNLGVGTRPDVQPRKTNERKNSRPYSESIIPGQVLKVFKNVGCRTHATPTPLARPPISLPFEILSMIAGNLSSQTLIAWLSVSRLHRAVAHGLLFASVSLYFRSSESGVSLEAMTASGKQFQHANDMLERIASDEIFAESVRSLAIHGYGQRAGHEGTLLQAMKNLTSLKSLRISQSDLEPSVVQGILEGHPYLQTLSFGRSAIIPPRLAAISSLQSFSLWSIPNSVQNQETAHLILQNCGNTLRNLELGAIEGAGDWLEPAALSRIRSLSYCDGRLSSTALEMILTQGSNIEELILHVKPTPTFAPASLFKAYAKAFPNLRRLSLRINDSFALDLGLFNAILEFIRDRPNMEMLAVQDFSGAGRMVAAGLGGCLATLPGLKALKLSARYLKGSALSEVLSHIPRSLDALAIETSLTPDDLPVLTQLEPFFLRLRYLRGIFIHSITKSRNFSSFDQAIRLALQLTGIEFVGIQETRLSVKRGVGGAQFEPLDLEKVDPVIDWVLEWRSKDLGFVLE